MQRISPVFSDGAVPRRCEMWAYTAATSEPHKAVVYGFTAGRAGEHARVFLGHAPDKRETDQVPLRGHLVCDDFAGYKALFGNGITELGCMVHALRKFVEQHAANKIQIAGGAIELIGQLYAVERDIQGRDAETRLQQRRTRAAPIAAVLHEWLGAHRAKVPDGTATTKAIDYSLTRWAALTHYLED